MIGPVRTIGPSQRLDYRRVGYAALQLSSAAELVYLRQVFDRTVARARRLGTVIAEHDRAGVLSLEKVVMKDRDLEALRDTVFYRRGDAIAAEILRAPAGALLTTPFCIRKPPRAGITALHQHPPHGKPPGFIDGITVWMTLDGVDRQNGCLTFWPRSQRMGLLPYDAELNVKLSAVRHDRLVPLPLRPGGAVVLHDRVVHGALANPSGKARRALALYCMRLERRA